MPLPIAWIPRDQRYAEKLATPDVSVADLIGEIDPIKVAEGRYLADTETIHYGLIPRTNRGIFAINELPDLTEKVQVGLFNLMEEKDVQIKGYKIRLPVDVIFVASANPEDYTSRGRIITPLKDRFDIQIRTHYPKTIEHEVAIMEQECSYPLRAETPLRVPQFMKDILAQITFEARASNEINQSSGVSVRVTINNYEAAIANAEKRAIRTGENEIVPRLSDLHSLYASTAGKLELEYAGEDKKDDDLIERLINRSVLKVFDRYLKLDDMKSLIGYFEEGWGVEVSDTAPSSEYLDALREVPGLREVVEQLGVFESPGPDGDRERADFRGPASASEAQQGSAGRALRLSRLNGATRFARRLPREHPMVTTRYTQWDGTQQLKLDSRQGVREARRVPLLYRRYSPGDGLDDAPGDGFRRREGDRPRGVS